MTKNPSKPHPAGTSSPEISWEKLDRLDWNLWVLAILLILILSAGLLSFMFPAVFWMKEGVAMETQQRAFFGFCVLLGLIQVYLLQKQANVRRLKRELIEAQAALGRADREAAIQSFQTLPNEGQFHDALAMEFRRASTSRERLAVVLFTVRGTSLEMLGSMTRMLRSMLREGETLYRISDQSVGVILPGMQLSNAASFATLAEDISGMPKGWLEVCTVAYPDDVSSLAELEKQLRGRYKIN